MSRTDVGMGARVLALPARARGFVRRVARASGDAETDGRQVALAAVRAIEKEQAALPPALPSELLAVDRLIAREDLPARVRTMLPSPWRHRWDPQDPAFVRFRESIAADLIVQAKYDLGPTVKLRAAYGEAGLVLGVLPEKASGVRGVSRTIQAHVVVGRYAPHLIPPLVAFGEVEASICYVLEKWVDGRPLMTSGRLAGAVPAVVAALQEVHRGYGSTRMPLSRWAPDLSADWAALGGTGLVPQPLLDQVAALIDRDATLRCSWTHGDPVSSNVVMTDEGVVLIDWENAGNAPVMIDGAKLHLFADAPQETLATVLESLGHQAGRGLGGSVYSPQEELALVHARSLAIHPRRAARLAGHAREEKYAQQSRRQVERLAEALAI